MRSGQTHPVCLVAVFYIPGDVNAGIECMYTCMHIGMYVCMHACMYVLDGCIGLDWIRLDWSDGRMHVCVQFHTHARAYCARDLKSEPSMLRAN